MYSSKIVADSLSPQGERLTTFEIVFPRIVLAEFNTHRMFSRNSASSRAIPFDKMVKTVKENPFIPIAWQKDHKGMQGTEYITDKNHLEVIEKDWLDARDQAVYYAKRLSGGFKMDTDDNTDAYGDCVTKQLCNRLLEPFMWHKVLITSGRQGLENFFELRCPQYLYLFDTYRSKKDVIKQSGDRKWNDGKSFSEFNDLDWLKINSSQADIHIQAIAELMWDSYNESVPKQLKEGEWHIPYGDDIDLSSLDRPGIDNSVFRIGANGIENCPLEVVIATAKCAQVSYTVIGEDGKPMNYAKLISLHDRLKLSKHWSPFEHCARAMSDQEFRSHYKGDLYVGDYNEANDELAISIKPINTGWCRNFRGFIQYRALVDTK